MFVSIFRGGPHFAADLCARWLPTTSNANFNGYIFAYFILGRSEAPLEQWQPEGFRSNRRIEEHLFTANMVMDRTLLANDLSKAFDRADWKSLWGALRLHGASPHLIWFLQPVYDICEPERRSREQHGYKS